eukprot:ANDGO_08091.mRNA.1 hypothetical protein
MQIDVDAVLSSLVKDCLSSELSAHVARLARHRSSHWVHEYNCVMKPEDWGMVFGHPVLPPWDVRVEWSEQYRSIRRAFKERFEWTRHRIEALYRDLENTEGALEDLEICGEAVLQEPCVPQITVPACRFDHGDVYSDADADADGNVAMEEHGLERSAKRSKSLNWMIDEEWVNRDIEEEKRSILVTPQDVKDMLSFVRSVPRRPVLRTARDSHRVEPALSLPVNSDDVREGKQGAFDEKLVFRLPRRVLNHVFHWEPPVEALTDPISDIHKYLGLLKRKQKNVARQLWDFQISQFPELYGARRSRSEQTNAESGTAGRDGTAGGAAPTSHATSSRSRHKKAGSAPHDPQFSAYRNDPFAMAFYNNEGFFPSKLSSSQLDIPSEIFDFSSRPIPGTGPGSAAGASEMRKQVDCPLFREMTPDGWAQILLEDDSAPEPDSVDDDAAVALRHSAKEREERMMWTSAVCGDKKQKASEREERKERDHNRKRSRDAANPWIATNVFGEKGQFPYGYWEKKRLAGVVQAVLDENAFVFLIDIVRGVRA